MTDTPEPDEVPEQDGVPERSSFRTFDGEETWDADALNRAYAQLRNRRSAAKPDGAGHPEEAHEASAADPDGTSGTDGTDDAVEAVDADTDAPATNAGGAAAANPAGRPEWLIELPTLVPGQRLPDASPPQPATDPESPPPHFADPTPSPGYSADPTPPPQYGADPTLPPQYFADPTPSPRYAADPEPAPHYAADPVPPPPRFAAPTWTLQPATDPGPPRRPGAPRTGSGRSDRPPLPSRGLFVAGVGSAAAAVLAAVIWLLVDFFGTPSGGSGAAPPAPTSAVVIQTTADNQPTDTDTFDGTDTSNNDSSPTADQASSPLTDPAQVVEAFYAAINSGDFTTAWNLGGDNLSSNYNTFVAGYNNTEQDEVSAQDTGPTTASIELTATQTDGSTQQYSGTYTVVNGVITSADVSPDN